MRMLVAEVLEDLGYTALEAPDGAAGLRVLQSATRIDLLITDVGLPGGMNGRQLADAGRTLRPGLKVLFITGYAENAAVGNGHLEPGMHVLTKPFAMEDLASRITDIIEEARGALPFPIQRIQTDRGQEFFAYQVQDQSRDWLIKFRPTRPRSPHLRMRLTSRFCVIWCYSPAAHG